MKEVQARLILEILGRPPEHIKQGLKMLIDKLEKEEGVKINEKKTHEPVPVKDSKDLYTSFAELTISCDSLNHLLNVMFLYMPANVEIIEPEIAEVINTELNASLNYMLQRLHQYDAVTKNTLAERNFLIKKLYEVAPQMFKKELAPFMQSDADKKEDKKEGKEKSKIKKAKKKK